MLVHKRTMGVLDTFWTGAYRLDPRMGTLVPVEQEYVRQSVPGLDAEDWWEVPRRSKLGRKLRLYYPWVEPVVDETGELVDVELQEMPGNERRKIKKELLEQEAARRGYRAAARVRPKGLMPFLMRQTEKPAPE